MNEPLKVLRDAWANCQRCALHERRTSVVFGAGPSPADVLLIGEAPGREEDETGQPFVGRAGRLLRAQLERAGLSIDRCYFANLLCCRPPSNRVPMPPEVESCRPHLDGIIRFVQPKVVVTLGTSATVVMWGTSDGITQMRGRPGHIEWTWRGQIHKTPAIATFHPSFLARENKPEHYDLFLRDIASVVELISEKEGTNP